MPASKVLASAWDDIAAIADYHLRASGADSAQRVTERLLDGIDLLATMPLLGPIHHDPVLAGMGYRKLILGKYLVVYRVVDGTPTVYRVFYGGVPHAGLPEE